MSGATGVIAGAAVAGTVASASASSKANKANGKALAQQKEAADRQADIAERQQQISEEQWARYKEVYQPLEDEYVNEAKGLGSLANQSKASTEARAEVAGAYSRAREQLSKAPGSNPTSQTYQQEANRINLAEAANSAAAQTAARRTQEDKGRAAMSDVINMGKGLPTSAASSLANAASTNGSAVNAAGAIYGNTVAAGQNSVNGVNSFMQGVGGLAQNKAFTSTLDGWFGSSPANTTTTPVATTYAPGQLGSGTYGIYTNP